jgi:hypothetical protein
VVPARGAGAVLSAYRYLSTSILSGAVIGDWLPMTPQNMSRNLNATGTFTGALNLSAGTAQENRTWVAAVEPEKSVLWTFQDGQPVWNGIIWDWPHQSILDNTLPISASTPDSLFSHRLITDDLSFVSADIFDIFRALAVYATSKTPNGQFAGLVMGASQAGVVATVSYAGADRKPVYDAWTDLISAYGFEYSFRPGVDVNGSLFTALDLGYPELGLPLGESGLAYNLPGNLLDYRFSRTGSTSSNRVYATASSSGTLTAINANSDFEATVLPWTAINGATLVQSPSWSSTGSFSAQFSGDGATANPAMLSEAVGVTPLSGYTLSAQLFSTSGWATVQLSIRWLNAAGTEFSAVSCAPVNVSGGQAGSATLSASAPGAAVQAQAVVQMTGIPIPTVLMNADQVILSPATPTSQAWASQLPHGQDDAVLADGYPLLESSAALSTAVVSSQAQIDGYADGLLPAVTGTQLVPLLTLGAGQLPAVKDITLGSYCQFNATSVLHPANPDGSPGLQLVGRVTGWTLYPPSQNQTEYSWIQLGQLEEVM